MIPRTDRQRCGLAFAALLVTVFPAAALPALAQESEGPPPPVQQESEQEPPTLPPQEPIFDPVAAQLAPGMPDEVVTTNGSRLIGEFKELKNAQLKFKVTATGNIYVKWELVRTVRTSRFFEVALANGIRFYGQIVGTDDGRLFVGVGQSFTEVDRREVVAVTRLYSGFWERQVGSLNIGFGLSKASGQTDLTVNLASRARTRTTEWQVAGSLYQRAQEGADRVDRSSLALGYTRFLPRSWVVVVIAQAEHNNELSLDLRTMLAAGGGYHLVRNIRHDLLLSAGLAPNREVYLDDTPTALNFEGFFQARYTFYFLGATDTRIELSTAVLPSFTIGGRYRFVNNLSALHEFTTHFNVNLNAYHTYDTKPPTSDPEASGDYNLSLGVGVTW